MRTAARRARAHARVSAQDAARRSCLKNRRRGWLAEQRRAEAIERQGRAAACRQLANQQRDLPCSSEAGGEREGTSCDRSRSIGAAASRRGRSRAQLGGHHEGDGMALPAIAPPRAAPAVPRLSPAVSQRCRRPAQAHAWLKGLLGGGASSPEPAFRISDRRDVGNILTSPMGLGADSVSALAHSHVRSPAHPLTRVCAQARGRGATSCCGATRPRTTLLCSRCLTTPSRKA